MKSTLHGVDCKCKIEGLDNGKLILHTDYDCPKINKQFKDLYNSKIRKRIDENT